jgi:hypothetical protein
MSKMNESQASHCAKESAKEIIDLAAESDEDEEQVRKSVHRGPPGRTPPPSPVFINHARSRVKRTFEEEVANLKCPICWEEASLSHRDCRLFVCSHYVCRKCYEELEGSRCPMCRKDIKVDGCVIRPFKLSL